MYPLVLAFSRARPFVLLALKGDDGVAIADISLSEGNE